MRSLALALLIGCGLGTPGEIARCEADGPDAAEACVEAGRMLLDGERVARDPAAARRLWTRGCELGSGESCLALAVALGDGAFGPPDPRAREQWFAKACQRGSAGGCVGFAAALEGRGESAAARTARQRACQLGDDASCEGLE